MKRFWCLKHCFVLFQCENQIYFLHLTYLVSGNDDTSSSPLCWRCCLIGWTWLFQRWKYMISPLRVGFSNFGVCASCFLNIWAIWLPKGHMINWHLLVGLTMLLDMINVWRQCFPNDTLPLLASIDIRIYSNIFVCVHHQDVNAHTVIPRKKDANAHPGEHCHFEEHNCCCPGEHWHFEERWLTVRVSFKKEQKLFDVLQPWWC